MYKWSVMEQQWSETCLVNCWSSSLGCRRLKKRWLKSVHRIRIEHVRQSLDKDDESPLVSLIFETRNFGKEASYLWADASRV